MIHVVLKVRTEPLTPPVQLRLISLLRNDFLLASEKCGVAGRGSTGVNFIPVRASGARGSF